MRLVPGILALSVIASASGCSAVRTTSTADDEDPAPRAVRGWQRVDLPGEIRDVAALGEGVLVATLDDGTTLTTVDRARTEVLAAGIGVPGARRQVRVTTDDAFVGLTGDPGSSDAPAEAIVTEAWHESEVWSPRLADENGVRPGWVSPVFDGEEEVRYVGAVSEEERWRVRAWLDVGEAVLIDAGDALYSDSSGPPTGLLAAAHEGGAVVAGDLRSSSSSTASPSVWFVADRAREGLSRPWRQLSLDQVPDAFTDISAWGVGWWLAGHRGGRPVVVDFSGSLRGTSVAMPETDLDPVDPTVRVSGIPFRMVLGLKSTNGPEAWVASPGGWTEMPEPPGTITDLASDMDTAYVVTDHQLWWQALPD